MGWRFVIGRRRFVVDPASRSTGGLLVAVAAKYNAESGGPSPGLNGSSRTSISIWGAESFRTRFFGGRRWEHWARRSRCRPRANGILVHRGERHHDRARPANAQPPAIAGTVSAPACPKFLAHKIHSLTGQRGKGRRISLPGGASTFLPFRAAFHGKALSALRQLAKGSVETGALVMAGVRLSAQLAGIAVALGPCRAFATGAFQRYFLKFAGAAVVILGIFNIQSGLTADRNRPRGGFDNRLAPKQGKRAKPASKRRSAPTVPIVDGKQIVNMKLVGYTYEPHQFPSSRRELPVEWHIDGAGRQPDAGAFLSRRKPASGDFFRGATSTVLHLHASAGPARSASTAGWA